MTVDSVIDLAREAMMMTLTLAAPPLIVGLLIGLVVAVLQAVTQVHDPSISLVPRMIENGRLRVELWPVFLLLRNAIQIQMIHKSST